MGEAYLQQGDLAGAQKELNHALSAGLLEATLPLARSYVATQSWDPLSDLKAAETLPAADRAEVLALKARGAVASGDRDGATGLLEQAQALAASAAPVVFTEAVLALVEKDQELAEQRLRRPCRPMRTMSTPYRCAGSGRAEGRHGGRGIRLQPRH